MFTVRERTLIQAPIERVFALSTNVEIVQKTLGMSLIGGTTRGHISAGSRVVWSGRKFLLPTQHHTLITAFHPPHPDPNPNNPNNLDNQAIASFEDSQEHGRFRTFRHLHFFRETPQGTELEDIITFSLPFGLLGRLAARFLLAPHIRKLARARFQLIRSLAESECWRRFLPSSSASQPPEAHA